MQRHTSCIMASCFCIVSRLKQHCRLLLLKHVCEAASALILPLLDMGACLLGDFGALCDRGCCGEWKKWRVCLCSLSFSEWKHLLASYPSLRAVEESLNATLQRMSEGERKSYINDKCMVWSLLSPVISPYFTLSSFSLIYPHLVFFFISPVSCSLAPHCSGTFCDILMFHHHLIYQFISLFFPTFAPPSPLVKALILFACPLFAITQLIYLALISLMCCNAIVCAPGGSQAHSLARYVHVNSPAWQDCFLPPPPQCDSVWSWFMTHNQFYSSDTLNGACRQPSEQVWSSIWHCWVVF